MPSITLEAIEAKQTELSLLIAKFKEQPQTTWHVYPQADIELHPGEHYAGVVLDQHGQIEHHLVLMAQRPDSKLKWDDAMAWATSVGGALPTRQEQALLYANCKPPLKPEWHWSSETHKDDAAYAWFCSFTGGDQDTTRKSYEGGAVAVRRV
jgi:hypothetical protein